MTLPDPQLQRDINKNAAEFLCVDLDTALTFAQMASSSARNPEARLRNRKNARTAYDTVMRLKEKVTLSPEESALMGEKLDALKRILLELGEAF